MDNMSPQQHQDSHSRGAQQDTKRVLTVAWTSFANIIYTWMWNKVQEVCFQVKKKSFNSLLNSFPEWNKTPDVIIFLCKLTKLMNILHNGHANNIA